MGFNFISQRGFTLVEVLTVMLVLVAIASITVESTKDFVFQGRYDITKDRYEKIKKAIIGDPNQVINGQPNISGFVADMGRLPTNLQELLAQGNNPTWQFDKKHCSNSSYSDQSSCESNSFVWIEGYCSVPNQFTQTNCSTATGTWTTYSGTGLGFGWRRGYIETPNDPTQPSALSDGWGNLGDNQNYGWEFHSNTPNANDLTIQSSGKNGCIKNSVPTCTDPDTYDADYPQTGQAMLNASDWQSTNPTPSINITITPLVNFLATPIARPASNSECTNGTWTDAGTPQCVMPLEYTQATCITAAVGGTWTAATATTIGYCSMVAKFPITQSACTNVSGVWSAGTSICSPSAYLIRPICLDFRYVSNGAISQITPPIQANITESGMTQTVQFNLPTNVHLGQAAIKITDCATSTTYPTPNRDFKIVDIFPNKSLNFDW